MYFQGQKELAAHELPENFLHVIGEPGIARDHVIPTTLTSRATGMYVFFCDTGTQSITPDTSSQG